MAGTILLFGFEDLPAVLAVSAAAEPLGAEVVPVARGDYGRPVAALAGLEGGAGVPYAGGPLGGRMMVLCGLEDRLELLLPALAEAGAGPDCLKAVLTDRNRGWNALRLFEELSRERRALMGR
nr:DUF3783 domain-containing protein [uncultured Oscillibacter sp.]